MLRRDGDSGVVGSVGGLVDGQGALQQRPGVLRLAEVPQDQGEVAQADGDSGVVGSVGGLVDGQGAFQQRPGVLRLAEVLQDRGEVVQADGDSGVVGSVGGLGRWPGPAPCSARASCGWPRSCRAMARLLRSDSDFWVVGSVGGLVDGQGPLQQRQGVLRLAEVLQDQ